MTKDDATWLNVAFVTFFALTAYIGFEAVNTVGIQTGWNEQYDWYSVLATAIGLAIGGALTFYLRMDTARTDYFLAAIGELRKVAWPTVADTKRMTIVVCVVVGVFAVIVSIFDLLWAKALRLLIA